MVQVPGTVICDLRPRIRALYKKHCTYAWRFEDLTEYTRIIVILTGSIISSEVFGTGSDPENIWISGTSCRGVFLFASSTSARGTPSAAAGPTAKERGRSSCSQLKSALLPACQGSRTSLRHHLKGLRFDMPSAQQVVILACKEEAPITCWCAPASLQEPQTSTLHFLRNLSCLLSLGPQAVSLKPSVECPCRPPAPCALESLPLSSFLSRQAAKRLILPRFLQGYQQRLSAYNIQAKCLYPQRSLLCRPRLLCCHSVIKGGAPLLGLAQGFKLPVTGSLHLNPIPTR